MPPPGMLPSRDSPGNQEQHISSQDLHPIYEFRTGVRTSGKIAPTAWLDQDTSGDYEPTPGEDRQFGKRKRSRGESSGQGSSENPSKKPKSAARERRRHDDPHTPIAVPSSEAERTQHGKLASTEDIWLSELDTASSFYPRVSNDNGASSSNNSSMTTSDRYSFRKHVKGKHRAVDDTPIPFGGIPPDDPDAQGCKSCLEYGLPCSMLENKKSYPCEFCVADGEDCDPIIEPLQKQPCTNCKRRRIQCTFKIDPERRGPCVPCAESSTNCVAGPLRQRTSTRLPSARGPSGTVASAELGRPIPEASQSQKALITPAIPHFHPPQFAPNVVQNTPIIPASLQFHPPQLTPNVATFDGNSMAVQSQGGFIIPPNHPSYPTQEMQGIEGQHGTDISRQAVPSNVLPPIIGTIYTRLAHPVQFNYESTMLNELITCHWCHDTLYGLIGLGPIEVEVIDYRNGQGFVELGNGHTSAGHEPSRMCAACTLARFYIVACIPHEILPMIPLVDPDRFPSALVAHYLTPGWAGRTPFEWCSVCPSPSSHYCCKTQEPITVPEISSDPLSRIDGCGLVLCHRCASLMVNQYGGVLERLLDGLKLEDENFEFRADANILHPKGELLRRFNA